MRINYQLLIIDSLCINKILPIDCFYFGLNLNEGERQGAHTLHQTRGEAITVRMTVHNHDFNHHLSRYQATMNSSFNLVRPHQHGVADIYTGGFLQTPFK